MQKRKKKRIETLGFLLRLNDRDLKHKQMEKSSDGNFMGENLFTSFVSIAILWYYLHLISLSIQVFVRMLNLLNSRVDYTMFKKERNQVVIGNENTHTLTKSERQTTAYCFISILMFFD